MKQKINPVRNSLEVSKSSRKFHPSVTRASKRRRNISNGIKVLFTAAELNPMAKVGGLADVMGALPKALEKLGVDARIAIPKYGIIDEKKYSLKKVADNIPVPFKDIIENISIFTAPLPGSAVPVYYIDNYNYLGQGGIYFERDEPSVGLSKEAERFTFLSRACLSIFEPLRWYPDIIHCHDWHVGLVPLLLKILAKRSLARLQPIKTLFTIHNLEYQGRYNAQRIMERLGISADDCPTLSVLHEGDLVSLQQAVLNSDYLNTVSPTYAREILTPVFGAGLEKTLRQRQNELVGILNGIDVDRFNPATDPDIAANFSPQDFSNKKMCKADLQKACGLTVAPDIPVIGMVTRLAEQKGLGLVASIADDLAKKNAQFILLGTGLPVLETMMRKMSAKYPRQFYSKLAFDAHFAQQIYAGSDLFMMPSKFEPCGLGQMIAMRYGTVPIVRATGGLVDTVKDFIPETNTGDGFVFKDYKAAALFAAVKRALALYHDQTKWYHVIKRVMQKDFSWGHSAKEYLKLYKAILR